MVYNSAFFGTHEAYFLILKDLRGEEFALDVIRRVMERNLGKSYRAMEVKIGLPEEFARVVGTRDESVGLDVKFPIVSSNKIIYQFHTDPFPGLNGYVSPEKLDVTYMKFKVDFLLGKEWTYHTTLHMWKGDPYTEHVIEKK